MFVMERTLLIVKPDAVQGRHIGAIIASIEELPELAIVAIKSEHWLEEDARAFYREHEGRPYFDSLVASMTAEMLVAIVIEGIDAVSTVRMLSGATKPEVANPGTFRRRFGTRYGGAQNATHSSDSPESAREEIALLFPGGV